MPKSTPTLITDFDFSPEPVRVTLEPFGADHSIRIAAGVNGSLLLEHLDQFDAIAAEVEKYRRMVKALGEQPAKAA